MVGGFVGGVLLTAALGAIIFAVFQRRRSDTHKKLFDLTFPLLPLMHFHVELKWMYHLDVKGNVKAVFPQVPTLPMAKWKE